MFAHLHRHSEYSVLDGVGTAQQYAERAAEIGQSALALTDHGTLSGALHHIKACNDVGIMPIVGVEAYYRPNRLNHSVDNRQCWHLTLIAKNLHGWHSLLRLTSEAYQSGFYYKPAIDMELIRQNSRGIICSSACVSGYLSHMIDKGDDAGINTYLAHMTKIFGSDFYIEIMPHAFDKQKVLNVELARIAQDWSLPLIATVDAHYPYEEWAETQDIVLMINTNQTLKSREEARERNDDVYEFGLPTLFLMDEQRVQKEFNINHPDLPADLCNEAINNTGELVGNIDFYHIDKSDKLPRIKGGTNQAFRIVDDWCKEGLIRIGMGDNDQYEQRLQYELKILRSRDVVDYFVIVGDLVRWAKERGIRVGAGRGSAAGCLVSYLIGITAIDPIAHGLLFERFLNPDRKGYPDIDIDIQHDRRAEVKEYLAEKWGKDHVADIVTHQTFGPRSTIQSVARVYGIPYKEVMDVTNSIDPTTEQTLEELGQSNDRVGAFAQDYGELWAHMLRIEGQIKAISKHAAGCVITDRPVAEYMPTMRAKDGSITTAWSDKPEFPIITEYGFPKFDLLGQDGLTKQKHALSLIAFNNDAHIDIDALPVMSDPEGGEEKVFQGFAAGMNLGVFQFEGKGISNLLRRIKPTSIRDISAANALYRPGPLEGGVAYDYGAIKNGEKKLTYWHESVKPFLEETYGLLVYQEQIMRIAQVLGGFPAGDADDLRKAMAKLYRLKGGEAAKFMNQFKGQWDIGCKDAGIDDETASEIWELILKFGGYGFNKSHSLSYAAQAYQDMWIKVNYPLEFYAALLTYEPDKIVQAIREARMVDIKFKLPDINESGWDFTIDNEGIRFGLLAIKNVGDAAVKEILNKRPFKSHEDFEERVTKKKCNAAVKKALLKSGALDRFGVRDDWTAEDKVASEKELLGISITGASITDEEYEIVESYIITEDEFDELEPGAPVVVGGEIADVKKIKTKKGDPMAFASIVFGPNQYSCTLFPRIFKESEEILGSELILVKGKKDDRGAVIVEGMCEAKDLVSESVPA